MTSGTAGRRYRSYNFFPSKYRMGGIHNGIMSLLSNGIVNMYKLQYVYLFVALSGRRGTANTESLKSAFLLLKQRKYAVHVLRGIYALINFVILYNIHVLINIHILHYIISLEMTQTEILGCVNIMYIINIYECNNIIVFSLPISQY